MYSICKEISSFVLQVSSKFKLIMFRFTAEYRSSDHGKRLILANCNSVGDEDSDWNFSR